MVKLFVSVDKITQSMILNKRYIFFRFTDESHKKAKSVVFTCAILICLAAMVFAGIYFSK